MHTGSHWDDGSQLISQGEASSIRTTNDNETLTMTTETDLSRKRQIGDAFPPSVEVKKLFEGSYRVVPLAIPLEEPNKEDEFSSYLPSKLQ